MADVAEVAPAGGRDGYRLPRHAEPVREAAGVAPGALGRAEAGHGDGVDSAAVEPEAVERGDADEKREGGVQPAGKAHDDVAAAQEPQARDEAGDLLREHVRRPARERRRPALLGRLP